MKAKYRMGKLMIGLLLSFGVYGFVWVLVLLHGFDSASYQLGKVSLIAYAYYSFICFPALALITSLRIKVGGIEMVHGVFLAEAVIFLLSIYL